jgi:eukaryotic-like serine/threonine-protein kinase
VLQRGEPRGEASRAGITLAVSPGVPVSSPLPLPRARPVELDEQPTGAWSPCDLRPRHPLLIEELAGSRPADSEVVELTEADLCELIEDEDEDHHLFAPPAGDPRVGTTIGDYEVIRMLACGGMGIVYLGRHRRLGRKVALKLPRAHVLRDADLTRRFQSEAMAAVQIGHPGVVDVLDYGIASDGAPYLVMELLEGGPLAARMTGAPMPVDFALRMGARVADTLSSAHAAGVIHRDLKPENVFLQRHRQRPDRVTVKVLDFGFCKLEGGAGLSPLTQQGLILGTPSYMAPEQCLATAPVDHRCDIYALGCILYELVTGRLPFSGTIEEVRLALRYRPVVAPRWHNRDLPAELDDLIVRMLCKDPGGRPSSMLEVAHALEAIRFSSAYRPRARLGSQGG